MAPARSHPNCRVQSRQCQRFCGNPGPFSARTPLSSSFKKRCYVNILDGPAAKPHSTCPLAVQDPSASHKASGPSDRLRLWDDQGHPPEDQRDQGERVRRTKAAPKGVVPRLHATSPWPWRRPSLREGRSVRHRQATGKTPPDQSSQPSAEELRARSKTGTLKFRRNSWHWRDCTLTERQSRFSQSHGETDIGARMAHFVANRCHTRSLGRRSI